MMNKIILPKYIYTFEQRFSSIPKSEIKKVEYMTDQLITNTWKGVSCEAVEHFLIEKYKVESFLRYLIHRSPEGDIVRIPKSIIANFIDNMRGNLK